MNHRALSLIGVLMVVVSAGSLYATTAREESARRFLRGVETKDQAVIDELTTERVYVARTTHDDHITIAREQSEVLPGFKRHMKDVRFTLGEFSGEGDFMIVCASGELDGREIRWLTSFEFRGELIKIVLFQEAGSLCEPAE